MQTDQKATMVICGSPSTPTECREIPQMLLRGEGKLGLCMEGEWR